MLRALLLGVVVAVGLAMVGVNALFGSVPTSPTTTAAAMRATPVARAIERIEFEEAEVEPVHLVSTR